MLQIAQSTDECSVDIRETLENTMVIQFIFNHGVYLMLAVLYSVGNTEKGP